MATMEQRSAAWPMVAGGGDNDVHVEAAAEIKRPG